MPRQISEEEYAYLQGRRQVAEFVESIYNDPKLANEAKSLIKKKYPNLSIPDYDIERRVDARFAREQQARKDAEAATKQKQEEANWKQERSSIQKSYGFTDEAMADLEKLMVEKNIGNYEAGALLYAAKNPKSSVPEYDSGMWHHDRKEGFKEVAKDPEGWARKEFITALLKDQSAAQGGR